MNSNPDFSPWIVPRIAAGIFALPLTAFALLVLRHQLLDGFDSFGAIFGSAVGTGALVCWWFALRGQHEEARAKMMFPLLGGMIVGGISFLAGFIGPIIFMPTSNQGPLLGIFITGPIGFVVGVVLGAVVGCICRSKPSADVASRK